MKLSRIPNVRNFFFDAHRCNDMFEEVRSINAKYGMDLELVDNLHRLSLRPASPNLMQHVVARLNGPFDADFVGELHSKHSANASFTLVFEYGSEANALGFGPQIESLKSKLGDDRINIMRPDVQQGQCFTASKHKILDNFVCDTRRVKYNPQRLGPLDYGLFYSELKLAKQVSNFISEHHMWHRANTDGYIAFRTPQGILITRTKANKANLELPEDMVLVTAYDSHSNTVSFLGDYLPSSDSVEASILFERHVGLRYIVHTHDSLRFTRNSHVLAKHSSQVPLLPYGEPELGTAIAEEYERNGQSLVIMREHGEVFLGSQDDDMLRVISGWQKAYQVG